MHAPRTTAALIAAAAALVAAVPATAAPAPMPVPMAQPGPAPISVGSLASLSGSAKPYGTSQQRGTVLAASVFNRLQMRNRLAYPPVLLRRADDRSDPKAATQEMERFAGRSTSAVIGPTLSPVAAEADPVAVKAGLPVLAATNTTLDISRLRTVWRISLSEQAMIPQTIARVRDQLGVRRAALIVDSADGYATGAAAVFASAAAAAGVTITTRQEFSESAGNIDQAVANARASSPQAVFVAARSAAAISSLHAIRKVDGEIPIVGGNGFNSDEVIAGAGRDAEGVICAASWNRELPNERSRRFVRDYRKAFGGTPDSFAATGYASVEVLVAVARAAGGSRPADIQRGLRRIKHVNTVLGRMTFSKRREAEYPAAVQVVRNGRFTLLGSPEPDSGDHQSDSILGKWSGKLRQQGMEPFFVWATIRSLEDGKSNSVRYSGLDCRGTWTPLGGHGSTHRFREDITNGRSAKCKGTGTVTLKRTRSPDRLDFTFRGGGVESSGTIKRYATAGD